VKSLDRTAGTEPQQVSRIGEELAKTTSMKRGHESVMVRRSILFVVAALCACGRSLDATDGGDGAVDAVCPSAVPVQGAHCVFGLDCEYGGSDGQCTTRATCGGAVLDGTWSVAMPPSGCGVHAASCPATFDALPTGSACPLTDAGACAYPEGICECTSCVSDAGASTQWACRAFELGDSACRWPRPPLGSACAVEGTSCWWSCCESISFGPNEVCSGRALERTGVHRVLQSCAELRHAVSGIVAA
jgi:hypothetical protein